MTIVQQRAVVLEFSQEKMSTRPSTLPSYARLALIDKVPEELWMEVCNTVQAAVIKTIPKKKAAKRLAEEALQRAEKRREIKDKGEKERCTYLNAEIQRIARRDKKAFLSDQCKEIEENKRM